MKKQTNQRRQTVLLTAIATIFLLCTAASTFAQAKTGNLSAFDNFSSDANHNPLFNTTKEFNLTKIQSNNLFVANLEPADDYPKPDFSDDDIDLPAPDFSAIQKYYDFSNVEYKNGDWGVGLYFVGKMTKPVNAAEFVIDFYGAEGVKVIDTNYIKRVSGDVDKVGAVARFYCYLPYESQWKLVKKVVITRQIH